MSISIREYAPGDLEACRGLWRDLTQRHREIYDDPSIGGADPGTQFDEHLAHPALVKLWLATAGSDVIGLCGLLIQHGESEIEPIVVRPSHRNGGVGAGLARHAIEESRRLGLKFVNVRPVARNAEAIRFFHREGFRFLGHIQLCLRLDEGAFSRPEHAVPLHGVDFRF
jgi:GNAT superfamily N-acetyltransferase